MSTEGESLTTDVPPSRLLMQDVPSTNTVAIMVQSGIPGDIRSSILALCQFAIGGKENEIQCIDFEQFDSARLIRVTFFDSRNAIKCQQWLQSDNRFSTVLDFRGGSNRSVVVPRIPGVSIDLIFEKFGKFGEVEKMWFNQDSLTLDYYDSRSPLRIVDFLEDAALALSRSPAPQVY
jgi:hypothetical protein